MTGIASFITIAAVQLARNESRDDVAITGGGLTGQWLGDYQLQGVLGVGGMAEVYQARDAVINREVAVKVLPLALAADPSYVERFRNEAQAVGALNHPNIVPVHPFGEQGPYLYLVMPLMKESLRDRLLRGVPLPVEEAVQIAVQILSGLGAAHAQGVVHRDVKPENILLDDNGVAKLTDFGIARRITIQRASGGPTLAGTGLPVGTPQYMAPEQLRGEDLDQRADIYALGSVLYEMLTGLPPHIADTPYEVASLVLTAQLAPPSERNPEIWPELEQVMLQGAQPQARRPLRQRHQLRRGAAGCAAGARHRVDRAGERGQVLLRQVPPVAAAREIRQWRGRIAVWEMCQATREHVVGWAATDPAEPPTVPSHLARHRLGSRHAGRPRTSRATMARVAVDQGAESCLCAHRRPRGP